MPGPVEYELQHRNTPHTRYSQVLLRGDRLPVHNLLNNAAVRMVWANIAPSRSCQCPCSIQTSQQPPYQAGAGLGGERLPQSRLECPSAEFKWYTLATEAKGLPLTRRPALPWA